MNLRKCLRLINSHLRSPLGGKDGCEEVLLGQSSVHVSRFEGALQTEAPLKIHVLGEDMYRQLRRSMEI